ncbi:MAG: homoserine dehydrogenase [Rhodospirillales bacterium]|nr:homoserine dehydrogenase [Rhodospirillales bacterium]MCB9995537.1 homoserine dehydrogenase [Rhodospirillales bacterium]
MSDPLRIGIAGLGTVGAGVIRILQQHADLIAQRAGRRIDVVAVSARSKGKDRGVDLSAYDWVEAAPDLALRDDLDVVVELIGGEDGDAKALLEAALGKGIAAVSANKALLAHHGCALAAKAEQAGVPLMYEAAVAGGIPIIKSLREGFAANDIKAVYGILNGTCNYILTTMRETGRSFADVLKEAQDMGYAEADPTFDVEGIDTAHKLCLLSALAFGVKPDFEKLATCGISTITATDISNAQELGYRIKLLGISKILDGKIIQMVEPCLVPEHSTMGAVEDAFNAVFVEGDFVDTGLAVGRGAGAGPTASAVVADLIDIARGHTGVPVFGVPVDSLADAQWGDPGDMVSRFYMSMIVKDEPGVLAEISAIMRDHDISMEAVQQKARDPQNPVPIVIISHEARQAAIAAAIESVAALDSCVEKPVLMRIESF